MGVNLFSEDKTILQGGKEEATYEIVKLLIIVFKAVIPLRQTVTGAEPLPEYPQLVGRDRHERISCLASQMMVDIM